MPIKQISILFILIFSILTLNAYSYEDSKIRGEIAFGSFLFSPSGHHSLSGSNSGTNLGLESDMGMSDDNAFFGRAKLEPGAGMPGIYINASIFETKGSGKKAFTYGDLSFKDTSSYDSKITLEDYNLSFFYHIKSLTTATIGRVKLDIGGTIKWFEAKGTFSQSSVGTVSGSQSDYALAFYADLLIRPVERVELGIEWNGLSFTDASFSNITGRFSYQVMGPFFLSVGYTTKNFNMNKDGFNLDMDTKGAFLEGGYRF